MNQLCSPISKSGNTRRGHAFFFKIELMLTGNVTHWINVKICDKIQWKHFHFIIKLLGLYDFNNSSFSYRIANVRLISLVHLLMILLIHYHLPTQLGIRKQHTTFSSHKFQCWTKNRFGSLFCGPATRSRIDSSILNTDNGFAQVCPSYLNHDSWFGSEWCHLISSFLSENKLDWNPREFIFFYMATLNATFSNFRFFLSKIKIKNSRFIQCAYSYQMRFGKSKVCASLKNVNILLSFLIQF